MCQQSFSRVLTNAEFDFSIRSTLEKKTDGELAFGLLLKPLKTWLVVWKVLLVKASFSAF